VPDEIVYPCVKCGGEVSEKRFEVGYNTCLKCGEAIAQLEIKRKSRQVAVAYNKGPYTYITPGFDPKAVGRK